MIDTSDNQRSSIVLERFEIAAQAAKIGIFDYDIVNGTVYLDNYARKLWVFSPDFKISYDACFKGIHPDDRQRIHHRIEMPSDHESDVLYKDEYRVINCKKKQIIWVYSTGKVFFINGNPVRLVGAVEDITERKRIQEEIQKRIEELAAANRELESFSYSVSHDLRSPLNAINCLNEMLLEEYSERLDNDGSEILNRIQQSIRKMASTIDDILRLSGISREPMNRQEINLNPISHSIIHELRQSMPERNVTVTIADTLPAFADARLMTIALSNLIGNAWKYSGLNPEAHIEIGTISSENEKVFFVRDNGIGFDMKFANRLFKPFQRLHSGSQFSGTGIGLAIVHKIIQRHGGKIRVESEVEKGSTFYFTLESPVEIASVLRHEPLKILIVDDDSNDVFFTKRALRKIETNSILEVATDGDQAIKLLSADDTYHVILIDLKLPGIGGIEILRFVKSHERLKHIPVAVLSSSTMSGDIEESYDAGAVNYINKSFVFKEFSASLKEVLDTLKNTSLPSTFLKEINDCNEIEPEKCMI